MKTQKVAVIRVSYEDKNLRLTNRRRTDKLQGELKAIREQRIDALLSRSTVKELRHAERAHQRNRRAGRSSRPFGSNSRT